MDPPIPPPPTTIPATPSGGGGDDGPKDATNILKGKRTKRQRPIIPTHSSAPCVTFNPSPTTPYLHEAEEAVGHDDTIEDEDIIVANCLILLSKGHNAYSYSPRNNNSNSNNNSNNNKEEKLRFCSKRYIQISPNGLTGMYVYECKTCGRTFPTFQALGGHRASHKKPRIVAFSNEDDPSPHSTKKNQNPNQNHYFSSSHCMQLNHTKKSPSKLHECSICASEFNSGQALGGHMRKHRAATANTALSLVPYRPFSTFTTNDHGNQKPRNNGLSLDLDLNLPAAPETAVPVSDQDHHRESGFKFTANLKKQQPDVSLTTAPTLVDCHY